MTQSSLTHASEVNVVHRRGHGNAPVSSWRSWKSDTIWSLLSAIAQAGQQAGIMIVLSRWLTKESVGQYALAVSVAMPLHLFADRAVRTLQATADCHDAPVADYLGFRAIVGGVALTLTALLLVGWPLTTTGVQVVLMVGLSRFAEGLSQTLYGRMHRQGLMREIGTSQILRSLVVLVSIALTLAVSRRIELALCIGLLSQLVVLRFYDERITFGFVRDERNCTSNASKLNVHWRLKAWRPVCWSSLPLGVSTFLVTLWTTVPRLALSRTSGEAALGIFSVIGYVSFPATLLVTSLVQAATPRLSALYRDDPPAAKRFSGQLFAIVAILSTLNCVLVWMLGPWLLAVVFGPDYNVPVQLLNAMSVAAAVGFVASVPATSLVAQRNFRLALSVVISTTIVCVISSMYCVHHWQMWGAVVCLAVTQLSHLVVSLAAGWWVGRGVPALVVEHVTSWTDPISADVDDSMLPANRAA